MREYGSKDGKESGVDKPNVRVTRLQLDEIETAVGVFEQGGGRALQVMSLLRIGNSELRSAEPESYG